MISSNPFVDDTIADAPGAPLMAPCKAARRELAVVRISGDEARDFLHGQLSADLRALIVGGTLVTAWLSPKGRVLFMPRLLRRGEQDFFALLPVEQAAAFCKRLRMFVLRAKVVVEDLSASHGVLVLDGAAQMLIDSLPADDERLTARDGERHWLLAPRALLATVWDALPLPAQSASGAGLADIARGDITLAATLSDEFLPQELNLDVRDGVSFNKGCYPGQEIVARVKFRGSVKRRVQRLALDNATAPPPGTRLVGADGAPHATVIMSAVRDDAHSEVLAVVDVDSGPLHLADAPHALIEPLPLPYPAPGA